MIDSIPPQHLDSELAVLGSVLIDRDAIIEIADFLHADDFYRQAHGRIYTAMLGLFERREPIDIVTVAAALEQTGELEGVGGASFLSQLGNDTPTAVHVSQYARVVERKAVLRRLISAAGKIAAIGYEDGRDIQESIDRAEQELFAVSRLRKQGGFTPLTELLQDAYDRLEAQSNRAGQVTGIATGFPDLDKLTLGFQPSDLVILAARPSVGKTSLALNIAEYAAFRNAKSVGVFSLEMSREQLVERLLSSVARIDGRRLKSGYMTPEDFGKVATAMNDMSRARLFIDDTPSISPMELRTKARRLQIEEGVDLLVVDYLQLMKSPVKSRDPNRVQEVTEISRSLKALARAALRAGHRRVSTLSAARGSRYG